MAKNDGRSDGLLDADGFLQFVEDWTSIPSFHFRRRYPWFEERLEEVRVEWDMADASEHAATAFLFAELASEILHAQSDRMRPDHAGE